MNDFITVLSLCLWLFLIYTVVTKTLIRILFPTPEEETDP